MKNFMLCMLALIVLSGATLFAQGLTGTWQGALKIPQAPNEELRVVFKISVSEADHLQAEMFSIDQGGQPIKTTAVTQSGSTVKITVTSMNGNYEGKLSADGKTIAGTWTQGAAPLPLTLVKATPETAWTIPEPLPPPNMMDEKAG